MSSIFSYLMGTPSAPKPAASLREGGADWQFVATLDPPHDSDFEDEFVLVATDKVSSKGSEASIDEPSDVGVVEHQPVVVPDDALVFNLTADPILPTTQPTEIPDAESLAWIARQTQVFHTQEQVGLRVAGTWGSLAKGTSGVILSETIQHPLLLLRRPSPIQSKSGTTVNTGVGVTLTLPGGTSVPGLFVGQQVFSFSSKQFDLGKVGSQVVSLRIGSVVFGESGSEVSIPGGSSQTAAWGSSVSGLSGNTIETAHGSSVISATHGSSVVGPTGKQLVFKTSPSSS
eukprot:c8196_g1_i1.p1 GENE.c8196_g1_i1~~c8196_g1_i1.p1  ORF type:complete len:304 (+),score=66.78 c8196_g1_i1:52-912(+)